MSLAEGPDVAARVNSVLRLGEFRRRAMETLFRARLYGISLAARAPADLARRLPVRWPGEVERGRAILAGALTFAGEIVRDPAPLWFPAGATEEWLAELHGFGWLADLLALPGDVARDAARAFVERWIEENRAWHPLSWRSDLIGRRLVAWIAHFDELVGRDDKHAELRRALLASIVRQRRHLLRVAGWDGAGAPRLEALKGLVFADLALGTAERRLEKTLILLERELPAQVRPDGGHVSRSPAAQLAVMRDLIDLRTALRTAQLPLPEGLQGAIDRMAPLLRFFRHGDGRLAQFNGTAEEPPTLLELALTRSEAKGRAPPAAPHSGFQRLQAGKTLVIVDTGAPPARGLDAGAHAGILSLEMSHGRERLIVNCGAYFGSSREWRRAARNSAAHSTLVVADTNSAEIREDGRIGRRPHTVTCTRDEDQVGQWIEASHDGYATRFGLVHTRRLFLSAGGDDLRGEDRLAGRPGATFAVRFHLHPSVQISLTQEGSAALLRLPSGVGWRLRAEGAQLSLADSVYFGAGEIRKTQQVVLSGPVGTGGATVLWAIRREGRKPAETAAAPAVTPTPSLGDPKPAAPDPTAASE